MEMGPTDWWKTYFHGATNDVFHHVMGPRAPDDVARIERVLALRAESKILDVPCGQGRIAIELAARGHVVTGLDLASEEIASARARARERNVAVDLRVGDMRTDIPSSGFDAAVCFGHSFGYFSDEDNVAFLRAAYGSLRAGGKFAIETGFCFESYLPRIHEHSKPRWTKHDDIYLLQTETLDYERSRLSIEQTYITLATGSVETKRISCRMYTYRELVALMQSCGFEDIRGLDGTGDEPFRIGGHLLLASARPRPG
jgi:SAM-dependent methyltransferase